MVETYDVPIMEGKGVLQKVLISQRFITVSAVKLVTGIAARAAAGNYRIRTVLL